MGNACSGKEEVKDSELAVDAQVDFDAKAEAPVVEAAVEREKYDWEEGDQGEVTAAACKIQSNFKGKKGRKEHEVKLAKFAKMMEKHGPKEDKWTKVANMTMPYEEWMSETVFKIWKKYPLVKTGKSWKKSSNEPYQPRTTAYISKDGERCFEGVWTSHYPHFGRMLFKSGEFYEGHWDKWKHHIENQGIQYFNNGTIYQGNWHEGYPRKTGVRTEIDPDTLEVVATYKGTFLRGFRESTGTETYADGSFYKGFWLGGFKEGLGTYTYANGITLKTYFKKNEIVPDQTKDAFKGCIETLKKWPKGASKRHFRSYYGWMLNGKFHGKGAKLEYYKPENHKDVD